MFKEGIININKPADWTSQDVCAKLRGRLHIKRIGHTGTLDPMATGVLPVCIGRATRIIEYYDRDAKSYLATMKLGVETDTLDITGEVIATADYDGVTKEMILDTCSSFVGQIEQIPPKYSALKINGKKAYELAREGKPVEIKPRTITIYSLDVLDINLEDGIIKFKVSCSKGTYIRTLCDDIGHKLGCGGVMTSLERTSNGCFDIKDSVQLKELIEMDDDEINNHIISMQDTLTELGEISLHEDKSKAYINGNTIGSDGFTVVNESNYDNIYKVFLNEKFQGIGAVENGSLVPHKVINIEDN